MMKSPLAQLSHIMRDRPMLRQVGALACALVIASVLVVGPWYLRSRQQDAAATVRGVNSAAVSQSPLQYDDAHTVADFDSFRFAIPDGWQRIPEHESENGGVLLYLRGPEVAGQHLVIAVQSYPVAADTTLSEFMDTYTDQWGLESFPLEREIMLCAQPARAVGFTNEDGDNLVVFCLHRGQVHAIAMVSPADTMAYHLDLFHGVLDGLELVE